MRMFKKSRKGSEIFGFRYNHSWRDHAYGTCLGLRGWSNTLLNSISCYFETKVKLLLLCRSSISTMWVVVFLCIALGYEKLLSWFPKSVTIQWRRHFCFQQNNGRGDKSRESRFLQLSFGMMSMTDTIIQVGCLDIFLQNKSKGEKSGRHFFHFHQIASCY